MKQQYYAVNQGRETGVYSNWSDCQAQVKGYSGAVFKKFGSLAEAQAFSANGCQTSSSQPSYGYSERSSYSYRAPSPLSYESSSKPYTTVYTDGAAPQNGKKGCTAGVGVYFGPNDSRNVSEPLNQGRPTNQRAELQAIQRALEKIPVDEAVNIHTDSQYSIKCYEKWSKNWERNSWKNSKGADVENQDLIRNTLRILQERTAPTKFTHVKGHSGIHGNEMADQLAREGASKHNY
ncbi:hypothetical protein IWQ61_000133 [Dispira simplex]|nr:hypothetical protein IWQ61_000133 [Dispira simplex]